MERTKWIERTFHFDFPEGLLPNILERLRGVESRMKEMVNGLTDDETSLRSDGKWSVKEQIGHLVDLEDLHIARVRQMMERRPELTAADMKNAKTEEADHNAKSITELIDVFSEKRNRFVSLLESLDDDTQFFKSLHPRLQLYMRPIDVAFFTSEHDDHHLASVREILTA